MRVFRVLLDEARDGRTAGDDALAGGGFILQSGLDERFGQALALEALVDHGVVEIAGFCSVDVLREAGLFPIDGNYETGGVSLVCNRSSHVAH